MKNLNPFFAIGTIGMIVISGLHIFMGILLSDPSVHNIFFVLYPVFIGFLAIGFAQIRNAQTKAAVIEVHKNDGQNQSQNR